MGQGNLETRVLVMEKDMEWARSGMESIKMDLHELKAGQERLLMGFAEWRIETNERIFNLQAHADERISNLQAHTDERISNLQAHTDERISNLQAHTDERISNLQAHTDEHFIEIRREMGSLRSHTDAQFVEVHRELAGLYGAIAHQTRWILAALLGAATMVSMGLPVAFQLSKRFL